MVDPSRLSKLAEDALVGINSLKPLGLPITNLVISVASVAEAFVTGTLECLIAASPIQRNALGRYTMATLDGQFDSNWSYRKEWLAKGFGITVAGGRSYQQLLTLIEYRNALAHAGGRLTSRQVGTVAKVADLRRQLDASLDVECVGLSLFAGQQTQELSIQVAVVFIVDLDIEVTEKYPKLHR